MKAWDYLRHLRPGDVVSDACYVLDYVDGTRPRWIVAVLEELGSGGRVLVLTDPANARDGVQVAVTVISYPSGKTLRSQPHRLGGGPGNTLCDMDQQARYVKRVQPMRAGVN